MYHCRISDKNGKITKSLQQGGNPEEIAVRLKRQGYYLLNWEEKKSGNTLKGGHDRAVLDLTLSLSLMIQSGLTLREAFHVAKGLYTKGKTSQLVQQIDRLLQKGDSFVQAVESQGDIFPPLYLGMTRVGQKLGKLDMILAPLGEWLRERRELRSQIIGALIYPALVLFLVFTGVIALLFFFLPQMGDIVPMAGGDTAESLDQAMRSARMLIVFFVTVLVLSFFSGIVLGFFSRHFPKFSVVLDKIKLKIPLVNKFLLTREMLSLTFALSILTQCGVVLEEALIQAAEVLENRFLRKSLLALQKRLIKGESLSVLIKTDKIFPPEFSRWTALGERIGAVNKVFFQLKLYYQEEMNKILNRILTLAEPTVILLLGIVLLIIIVKVILPLLTLYGGME